MLKNVSITGFDLYTVAGINLESSINGLRSVKGFTSSADIGWNHINGEYFQSFKDYANIIKQSTYNALKHSGAIKGNAATALICGSNFFETSAWETGNKDSSLLWGCNSVVKGIAKELDINVAIINVSTACASGASVVVTACQIIESGEADRVIVIGYDFRTSIPENGMRVIGALSKTNISPFCLKRTGTDLADGLGVIILERDDFAKDRNAKIYANIIGYGVASDAYNITTPNPKGIALENAMRLALQKAEIETSKIQYINAHGSGTPLNDELETRVIKKVFGQYAEKLFINSSKSLIGHTLGAAGLIESIITVLALENGWLHPTANYTEFDPQCDLNYCTKGCEYGDFKYAMSNSIGFGGTNVSIVFEKVG